MKKSEIEVLVDDIEEARTRNEEDLVETLGGVLFRLKKIANATDISWDAIQHRSYAKNNEYNKQQYGE